MQKDPIEAICRKAGLAPARRETIRGRDVFVADGFSLLPHVTFRRFGIDQHDFPTGCHATIWWCARGEDKVDVGAPIASGGLAAPGKQWCPGPDRNHQHADFQRALAVCELCGTILLTCRSRCSVRIRTPDSIRPPNVRLGSKADIFGVPR